MLSICTSFGVKGIHSAYASTSSGVKKIKFSPAIFTYARYGIPISRICGADMSGLMLS